MSNAVSNLLLREADIALRMVQPDQGSLIAQRIGQVRLQACASEAYLAQRAVPQTPVDLLEHNIIAGDLNRDIETGFEALGLDVRLVATACKPTTSSRNGRVCTLVWGLVL